MKNIVIIGAGFGGLRTARQLVTSLRRKPCKIIIIDKQADHTLRPKLPEAIGGRIACAVQVPIEPIVAQWRCTGVDVEFIQTSVMGIDTNQHQVHTESGVFPYWRLVLATGSESVVPPITGSEFVLPIWNFEDACNTRRRVEFGVRAAKAGKGAHWLNFVVIGGGFVGVEIAAELAHLAERLCRQYGLIDLKPQVTVVELAPRVLSRSAPAVSRAIESQLSRSGVNVVLGHKAQAISADGVLLDNGLFLSAAHVLWAGGTRPARAIAEWGLADANGRIAVETTLRSLRFPSVYALGDAAYITDLGRPAEPSAHTALVQGAWIARNIKLESEGARLKSVRNASAIYAIATGPWQGVLALPGIPPITGPLTPVAKQLVMAKHLFDLGGLKLVHSAMPGTFMPVFQPSVWDGKPFEGGLVLPLRVIDQGNECVPR